MCSELFASICSLHRQIEFPSTQYYGARALAVVKSNDDVDVL